MLNHNIPQNITIEEPVWPRCDVTGGNCIGYDLVGLLGSRVNQALLEFIWGSADGARLSLQKNRQGFTAQVTGEVHRSEGDPAVSLDQFRGLKMHLETIKNRST